MIIGKGYPEHSLSDNEIRSIIAEALENTDLDGRRVLILIPDGTRTMPMPFMFDLFEKHLESRVSKSTAFDKEKVAAIKSAIEEGRYSINPERLAEKIIEHELGFLDN